MTDKTNTPAPAMQEAHQNNAAPYRAMSLAELLAEYRKGCGNTVGTGPEHCPECVAAFVLALEALNARQAADINPLSDEYVNAVIQRHGYQSPETVIARLNQWIGLHGGENGVTLLMYEAHKALVKLRAPVADERAAEHVATLQRLRADYSPSNGPMSELKAAALDAAIAVLASAPVAKPSLGSEDLAHEVWAAAQSPHGEPVEKSVARVAPLIAELGTPVAGTWETGNEGLDKALNRESAPVADERALSVALRAIAEYPTPGEGSMSAANMREIARAALASAPISGKCPPAPPAPPSLPYREVESGVIKQHRNMASAPVAGEARPTDWQAALRISELPEVDEVLGIFCNDGTQDNAVGLVQAILDAAPKASTVAGQVVAWMHEEDQNRVISAQQKAQAERDGGAYASSLRPYTIALGCLPAPQASVAAPAIGSNLINAACWKFVEAAVYAAVCHVLSAQSAEKPATSATPTASGPRQARVSGLPKTGNHTDGGSVYE